MTKEVFFTEEGLVKIKKELKQLKEINRPAIIESLKEARSLGDLSENAEYDAARNDQAIIESKIGELEHVLEHAKVIKKEKSNKVSIGTTVEIEYKETKEQEKYTIVGSKEADPVENKISNESPLAKALINKIIGATALVESPNGKYEVKILKIS